MANRTYNHSELEKFQKLLQYFVAHIEFVTNENNSSHKRRNNVLQDVVSKVNEISKRKCRTGQGYKNAKIQDQIKDWCDFTSINARIIICVQNYRGMGYFTVASYLYWHKTPWKIMARPDSNKEFVTTLVIQEQDSDIVTKELVVDDVFETPANKNLIDFYESFIDVYQGCVNNQMSPKNQNTNISNMFPSTKRKNCPLNLILYGPPGTGKTYNTVNKALEIILGETAYAAFVINAKAQSNSDSKVERGFYTKEFNNLKDNGRIVFTTFHQSMGYEDFVEGIKPETDKNTKNVTYDVKNGILKDLCYNIIKENLNPNDKEVVTDEKVEGVIKEKQFTLHENGFDNRLDRYVLIIDEINRGNVSQIFGELITLIEKDKRLGEDEVLTVKLPYSQKEFGVPNNLYIIGTMNTADRSVEALDTALRRRFSFEEMMPKYTDNDAPGIEKVICNYKMSVILKTINERIEVLKDREHQIGHSYFMGVNSTEELKAAFFDKIIPLLQEYFYGDYEKIQMVLGEGFVIQKKKDYAKLFAGRGDFDALPDALFSIVDKDSMSISAFESALHSLMK